MFELAHLVTDHVDLLICTVYIILSMLFQKFWSKTPCTPRVLLRHAFEGHVTEDSGVVDDNVHTAIPHRSATSSSSRSALSKKEKQ